MRIKLTSKKLSTEFTRRTREFSKPIAARLVVPPDLTWWYFHEYGTATHSEKRQTGPYEIRPVHADYLVFPDPHGKYGSSTGLDHGDGFARRYMVLAHPGVRPLHIISKTLNDISSIARPELARAIIAGGFRADPVRAALMNSVMPQAKNIIVQSISEALPGTRDDGRLQGRTAAQDFETRAEIHSII